MLRRLLRFLARLVELPVFEVPCPRCGGQAHLPVTCFDVHPLVVCRRCDCAD